LPFADEPRQIVLAVRLGTGNRLVESAFEGKAAREKTVYVGHAPDPWLLAGALPAWLAAVRRSVG
jgi:hypothetical protein